MPRLGASVEEVVDAGTDEEGATPDLATAVVVDVVAPLTAFDFGLPQSDLAACDRSSTGTDRTKSPWFRALAQRSAHHDGSALPDADTRVDDVVEVVLVVEVVDVVATGTTPEPCANAEPAAERAIPTLSRTRRGAKRGIPFLSAPPQHFWMGRADHSCHSWRATPPGWHAVERPRRTRPRPPPTAPPRVSRALRDGGRTPSSPTPPNGPPGPTHPRRPAACTASIRWRHIPATARD